MTKKIIVVMFILFIAILLVIGFNMNKTKTGNVVDTQKNTVSQESKNVAVSKENLVSFLESQEFVKDLPKNTIISLRFYNFNTGERQWENAYTISKGSVKEELNENYDILITIHSKYIPLFGTDMCDTIKTANNNGDLGMESKLSKMQLLWRFKGMPTKYRECFGI